MDRFIVNSSLIFSIGYDCGILEVEFQRDGIYEYQDVPPEVFHELTLAKSIGEYFVRNIKPVYKCRKIR